MTMQFSIRHLMVLTLVVACLLVLAKWLQPDLDLGELLVWLLVATSLAVIGLMAIWAILGTKHPLPGVILLFLIAVGAGLSLPWMAPAWIVSNFPASVFWLTATLTEALSLTVSLLVVRSCGYRLRRQAARRPGSDPMENS
jgi:hypothetical protein